MKIYLLSCQWKEKLERLATNMQQIKNSIMEDTNKHASYVPLQMNERARICTKPTDMDGADQVEKRSQPVVDVPRI